MAFRLWGRRCCRGFGLRGVFMDCLYLLICGVLFIIVTSQLSKSYSDAKAIGPGPEMVEPLMPLQGKEGSFEHRDEESNKVKPLPRQVVPVLEETKENDNHDEKRVIRPPDNKIQSHDAVIDLRPKKVPIVPVTGTKEIDGRPYPTLTASGNFVPMRRIVHLDLKGAPYKVEVFKDLFYLLNRIRATGILIEWEDMFPYEGVLAGARNGNAYTKEEVETILSEAVRHRLQIIPLVQTFGHLEWILKLEQFAHLRDDSKLPQVMCIGKTEAFDLIKDMLNQVGTMHAKYGGIPFYHIGADEIFNMGTCNETASLIVNHGHSKDRVTLFHIGRTAEYVKSRFNTTVLAWHDMFAHSMQMELDMYKLPSLIEPVIWSYAEDLDQYLSPATWDALRPFKRVWGSSAWKGADGPMRFHSNPIHYIRNHESWTVQFTRNWQDFEFIEGLILSGWSRYDHLALLAEILPVGIPSLAMSMETVIEARPMNGRYPMTQDALQCTPPSLPGYAFGCHFPGRRVYELVNEFVNLQKQLRKYAAEDYEVNGWLSRHAEKYEVSSAMYINKILPFIEYHQLPLQHLYDELKKEMTKMFFDDAVTEFLETYLDEDMEWLHRKTEAAKKILSRTSFPRRPYVKTKSSMADS